MLASREESRIPSFNWVAPTPPPPRFRAKVNLHAPFPSKCLRSPPKGLRGDYVAPQLRSRLPMRLLLLSLLLLGRLCGPIETPQCLHCPFSDPLKVRGKNTKTTRGLAITATKPSAESPQELAAWRFPTAISPANRTLRITWNPPL